jgi:hypothetical protein
MIFVIMTEIAAMPNRVIPGRHGNSEGMLRIER